MVAGENGRESVSDLAAHTMHRIELPRETAGPILVERLRPLVDLYPDSTEERDRIQACSSELYKYGPPVRDAVPLFGNS